MAGSQAGGARAWGLGAGKKRQAVARDRHGQTPLREAAAQRDSLQLPDLPNHSGQGHLFSWETPSQWQMMAGVLGPTSTQNVIPLVGNLCAGASPWAGGDILHAASRLEDLPPRVSGLRPLLQSACLPLSPSLYLSQVAPP